MTLIEKLICGVLATTTVVSVGTCCIGVKDQFDDTMYQYQQSVRLEEDYLNQVLEGVDIDEEQLINEFNLSELGDIDSMTDAELGKLVRELLKTEINIQGEN